MKSVQSHRSLQMITAHTENLQHECELQSNDFSRMANVVLVKQAESCEVSATVFQDFLTNLNQK